MKVRYCLESRGFTDMGCVRSRNEDHFLTNDQQGIWSVADGAGGHDNGHIASQMVVRELGQYLTTQRLGTDVQQVIGALRLANHKLIKRQQELGKMMASTASVIVNSDTFLACIWSGDSPVLLYRDNKLQVLTQDHNHMDELLYRGFSKDECEQIPSAQHLMQAIGADPELAVQTRVLAMRTEDYYVICSDGITKELEMSAIEKVLSEHTDSLDTMAQALKKAALDKGARDNITAVIVQVI